MKKYLYLFFLLVLEFVKMLLKAEPQLSTDLAKSGTIVEEKNATAKGLEFTFVKEYMILVHLLMEKK